MTEENNKHSDGWKHLPIETKRAVLNYFSKFESRDITFLVYIHKHQDQSVFGSRRNFLIYKEIQLRKQVNDYKLKLEKDIEFLHLEFSRNEDDTPIDNSHPEGVMVMKMAKKIEVLEGVFGSM